MSRYYKHPLAAEEMGAQYPFSAIWSGGACPGDSCQGRDPSCVGCQLFPFSLLQPILPSPISRDVSPAPSCTSHSWVREKEPFQPRDALGAWTTCSQQGVGGTDWPSSSSAVAPVTSLLQMQPGKSWCSMQQLHTAVHSPAGISWGKGQLCK